METIELSLPDELANRARELGLLEPAALNNLLREEIHRRAAARFLAVADRLAAADDTPMSTKEIQTEVRKVRAHASVLSHLPASDTIKDQ